MHRHPGACTASCAHFNAARLRTGTRALCVCAARIVSTIWFASQSQRFPCRPDSRGGLDARTHAPIENYARERVITRR
jgi:hypothetical protein